MIDQWINARAEALCNLWGGNPNDPSDWAEAYDHAINEWMDGDFSE